MAPLIRKSSVRARRGPPGVLAGTFALLRGLRPASFLPELSNRECWVELIESAGRRFEPDWTRGCLCWSQAQGLPSCFQDRPEQAAYGTFMAHRELLQHLPPAPAQFSGPGMAEQSRIGAGQAHPWAALRPGNGAGIQSAPPDSHSESRVASAELGATPSSSVTRSTRFQNSWATRMPRAPPAWGSSRRHLSRGVDLKLNQGSLLHFAVYRYP